MSIHFLHGVSTALIIGTLALKFATDWIKKKL